MDRGHTAGALDRGLPREPLAQDLIAEPDREGAAARVEHHTSSSSSGCRVMREDGATAVPVGILANGGG